MQVTPLDGVIILFMGLFLSQLLNLLVIEWLQRPAPALGHYSTLSTSPSSSLRDADCMEHDGTSDSCDSEDDTSGDQPSMCRAVHTWVVKRGVWRVWMTQGLYIGTLGYFFFGMLFLPLYEIKYVVMQKYTSVNRYSVLTGVFHLLSVIGDSNEGEDEGDGEGDDDSGGDSGSAKRKN